MARPITKNKEEYEAARLGKFKSAETIRKRAAAQKSAAISERRASRKSYRTQRRAVDPKLVRQLKGIKNQQWQREHKLYTELFPEETPHTFPLPRKKVAFAIDERKRKTTKAYAKSSARGKK